MKHILNAVGKWYQGKYIPPESRSDGNLLFVLGCYEQPLLAKILGKIGRFWLRHWQWILTILVAMIVPLVVALITK